MLPRLVGSGLSGEGALWEEWRLSPMKPVVPAPPAQAWLEPLSALAGTGPGPKVQPWKSVFGSSPETWFFWFQTLLSPHLLPGPICGSASQVLCILLCMLPQSHPPPPEDWANLHKGFIRPRTPAVVGCCYENPQTQGKPWKHRDTLYTTLLKILLGQQQHSPCPVCPQLYP